MAGRWMTSPGGLPVAVKTARDVVQIFCREQGVRFHAEPAPDVPAAGQERAA